METLRGKRLLILGGKSIMVDIVERAKALGVYTVVTDNRPYEVSPAKQIADAYYNISFSDIDRIVEIIRQEKIDGVLTGFTDSYLDYYARICHAAGLPCYGGKRQFEIATDKSAFKKACLDAGVPVIPGREVRTLEEAKQEAEKQGYPVIMKPADNSGSRGVIKCAQPEEAADAFSYAQAYSSIGVVIIEKYMECDNIAVSYFAADGEIQLTTTCERRLHISQETGSSITSFTRYPSRYTDRYIREVNNAVLEMLRRNGFNNGMIAFQAFVDENSFYFCEMCFRPSGGHHYILIEDQNNVDEMALLIEFAVCGSCHDSWQSERETPNFATECAMVKLIGVPGAKIARIAGIETVRARPDVISAIPMLDVGSTVGADGTTGQVLATIWYRCTEGVPPEETARQIAEEFCIEDEQGMSIARVSIM